MEHDSKPRYACPQCATKLNIQFGNCPECGFIGQMQDKDIRLRATNAAGKTITVDPLTLHQNGENQKAPKVSGTTSQYTCPRCGAKASKAYGRCPNRRSCGYVGTMQTSTIGKPRLK